MRIALFALLLSFGAAAADQSVTFKVDGWHSKGDAYKTEAAVRQVKGVRSTASDAGKKELTVVFDDAVATEATLRKAIAEAGYSGHR